MSADPAFMRRHFPPPLRFDSRDELIRHKSRLLMEARLLSRTSSNDLAALLFQQAGDLEKQLATTSALSVNGPSQNDYLISAASCYVLSGSLNVAKDLVAQLRIKHSAREFFANLPKLLRESARSGEALRNALFANDWDLVCKAASDAWGKLDIRVILLQMRQVALNSARPTEARDALQRLIIAYPQDLTYHLLYLLSSNSESTTEALSHARSLVQAMPEQLDAQVVLTLILLRAQRYLEAVTSSKRALEIIRQSDPSIANIMVTTAFGAASVALGKTNQHSSTVDVLAEAVQRLPEDSDMRALYALAFAQAGDEPQARVEALRAASLIENDERMKATRSHWPYTIGGALSLRQGYHDDAVRLLTTAVQMSNGPTRARNLNDLGVAYVNLGAIDDARTAFKSALAEDQTLGIASRNLDIVQSHDKTPLIVMPADIDMGGMANDLSWQIANHASAASQQRGGLAP